MDESFSRRTLLNLWVSDFLFNLTHVDSSNAEVPEQFSRLIGMESRDGPKMLDEYYPDVSAEYKEKEALYYLARARAKRWGIPISQVGLLIAVGCCNSAREVDMVLTVLFKRFCDLNSPLDHILDGIFVWEVLGRHCPTSTQFSEAWEKQILRNSEEALPPALVDRLKSSDFQ